MDPRGNIYEADPEDIPAEDKARLEGFLRGRAEAAEREVLEEVARGLREQLERMEEEGG